MELELSLPELVTDTPTDVPLEPGKIKKWLEGMPMLNVGEASHGIHKALMIGNRVAMDEGERLKGLEHYRQPISLLSQKLQQTYNTLPLPLPEKHMMTAEQVRHFQVEMAFGYKRVIMDSYARYKPKLSGRHAARLALPIQRAIRYLTCTLMHSYQFYAPYPVGTWKEIHMLYRIAEHHGITTLPVDDELNLAVRESSIDHVYKQALLLDLSDPYHLPARMINKIHRYLDLMAPLAVLRPTPLTHVDNACQFLIDLKSDRAGHVYLGEHEESNQEVRLLSTLELARGVHTQLTSMQQGLTPHAQGLGDDFFDRLAKEMLTRLINAWGVNPKRVFPRTHRSGAKMYVAFGLEATVFYCNGGRRFLTSADFMGPHPQRTRIGSFYAQVGEDKQLRNEVSTDAFGAIDPHHYSTWDVLDESAGGVALEIRDGDEIRVRVGEIVAMKEPGTKSGWSVGTVRWLRNVSRDRLEVGLQRLAPKATPLAIKTLSSDKQESEFMPALILPEIKAMRQPETLLTPRGVFKEDHHVYMDDSRMLNRALGTRLIEVTGSYERFQYELAPL